MPISISDSEDTDFSTYQAEAGNRYSGWNWYCMHCNDGRGFRWSRTDTRLAWHKAVA